MAYNEDLAETTRNLLQTLYPKLSFVEKKMFGGHSFLLNGNMSCGIIKDHFIARIDKAQYEQWVSEEEVGPMLFTGKEMRGLIAVYRNDTHSLKKWIKRSVSYVATLPVKEKKAKTTKTIQRFKKSTDT